MKLVTLEPEHGTPIQLRPVDLNDPRLGEFFSEYLDQLVQHGDVGMFTNTGHGMDFAHRLGEGICQIWDRCHLPSRR